jgi:hypothetical protein
MNCVQKKCQVPGAMLAALSKHDPWCVDDPWRFRSWWLQGAPTPPGFSNIRRDGFRVFQHKGGRLPAALAVGPVSSRTGEPQRGKNRSAPGNARGSGEHKNESSPERATHSCVSWPSIVSPFQGSAHRHNPKPGALARAVLLGPFGARCGGEALGIRH